VVAVQVREQDPLTDLNDAVTTRWIFSFAPSPLRVIGPEGSAGVVDAIASMLALDVGYRLAHHDDLSWAPPTDVVETGGGVVLELGEVRVTSAPTDHRPVQPSMAYRVDDGDASVVIAGDTVPCGGLDALCEGAGVLVHTAVRRDLIEQVGLARLTDVLDYHSSVEDTGATAQRGGVRTLVLTHLVPPPDPEGEPDWVARAAASFNGEIVVARDLTVVEV
jgi:ribonuclease Z